MTSDNETELKSAESATVTGAGESAYIFHSATRLAIAGNIVRDICNMIPVLVICGEKGEGKSSLCHLVASDIPPEWVTILFTETVESFEDVVRQIATRIGCGDVDVSRKAMNGTIDTIGAKLAELGQKVVIILDEAEMIYLATLERVRRMLDQLNDDTVRMQVVLCGRPLLLENLKQLSIVEFKEVPEKKYVLEPLSVEEVGTYIDHMVAIPGSGVSGSFLPAAIKKIHAVTGGNMSAVRQCVVDICGSDDRDAALAALVDTAEIKSGGYKKINVLINAYLKRLKTLPLRTRVVGAGVCVALLVLVLLFSGEDEKQTEPAPEKRDVPIAGSSGQVEKNLQQQDPSVQEQKQDTPAVQKDVEPVTASTVKETAPSAVNNEPVAAADISAESDNQVQAETQKADNLAAEKSLQDTSKEDIAVNSAPVILDDQEHSKPAIVKDTDTADVIEQDMANSLEPQLSSGMEQKDATVTDKQAESEPEPEAETITEDVAAEEPEIQNPAEETIPESLSQTAGETEAILVTEGVEEAPPLSISEVGSAEKEIQDVVEVKDDETIQEQEIPLIKSGVYKRLVAAEQPEESSNGDDSASSIVISSLAESEKREIALIPKDTYKIIKGDEIEEIALPEEENVEPEEGEISTPLSPNVLAQDTVPPIVQQPAAEQDVESRIEKPVLAQPILPVPSPQLPVTGNGTTILDNRMEAGYPWLAGRRDDRYTMQLMMLASEDAEEKIKGILSQREYGRASDNFYIFRKNSNPPVYFVFYGEYRNMTEARNARNTIPVF